MPITPVPTITPARSQRPDLITGRDDYADLGWPVQVDLKHQRLALPIGEVVSAVLMPVELGQRVNAALATAMLAGPVIAGPGTNWWTFLADPVMKTDLPDSLRSSNLRVIPSGGEVILPCGITTDTQPRWMTPPSPSRPLPTLHMIIATARRVLHQPGANT